MLGLRSNSPAPLFPLSAHGMITIHIPPRLLCGVYFLFTDHHLTYIGQSRNVLRRLGQHAESGLVHDEVHVIEAEQQHLTGLESYYISTLAPPGNSQSHPMFPKYRLLAQEYGFYHLPDGYDVR